MAAKRTIEVTQVTYDLIVSELVDVKTGLEFFFAEEGIDAETDDPDEYNEIGEWREICAALKELGA